MSGQLIPLCICINTVLFIRSAAESLVVHFVCLQSQYRFVCEAILKVYDEELVKPFETEPPVEKEE